MTSHPRKLFVEPTTRCNFRCTMCVKQSPDSEIEEGDLSTTIFNSLLPVFGELESLVFSGIGEPLLHPELERMIATARKSMPSSSWIGLQSNGFLLNPARAESLLSAGLDVISLSIDAILPATFSHIRQGGSIDDLTNAFSALTDAVSFQNRENFRIGIEFVLMKQNISDLPSTVKWAADNGASFVIISHLLAYDGLMESQKVHSPNTDVSKRFYDRWLAEADKRGLDLNKLLKQRLKYKWKVNKTPEEIALVQMGQEMVEEAYVNDIPVNFRNLIAEDSQLLKDAHAIIEEVKAFAEEKNIELILPEMHPKYDRKCHFVEDQSAFVSWKGQVHPCYFLWHQYACFQDRRKLRVTARTFGDLSTRNVRDIWNDTAFQSFRDQVKKYEYPYCGNCVLGPCNLLTEKPFEYDCYASDIPCGSCLWCGGLFNCLN